jgi:hypothetical protein
MSDSKPETQLTMIDGREALLMVLAKPKEDDPEVVIVEAHCSGLDKMQAARILIGVARKWKAEAEASDG